MKVAFAMINCNRRDGSARAVNEVAECLHDFGHDVHLYARKAEDLDLAKVCWHRVPGPGWPEVVDFTGYYCSVNHRLRSHDYDLVHSIGPNTRRADVVTIQNVQPAKKIILDRLGRDEKVSLPRRLTRALYLAVTSRAEKKLYTATASRRAPLFLPVSRGVEAELRQHYDIGRAPVRIIPNAADTDVFRPCPEAERLAWRVANGLQPSDFVCIFSGGEWARKGLELAIRALAQVPDPKVKLFVGGDDPDRPRYVRMTADLELSGRVIFGGFRRDMAMAFAAADLFLFPSYYEAFSLATIEAAACGLPVIAAKINGTEDFIQPGVTGEFVAHDPGQIADTLRELTANLSRCRQMGANARRLVEENYTWERVARLTEEAYREYSSGMATGR